MWGIEVSGIVYVDSKAALKEETSNGIKPPTRSRARDIALGKVVKHCITNKHSQ